MTINGKFKQIRKKKNLTQKELAKMINCDRSYIARMESGSRDIPPQIISAFKIALEIECAPLTNEDIEEYIANLCTLNELVSLGQLDKAKKLHQNLELGIEWVFEQDIVTLYELFTAEFYRVSGDMKAYEKTIIALEKKQHEFNYEHKYWYWCQKGSCELVSGYSKNALLSFLHAENIGDRLGLAYETICISIARCLTDIAYVLLSIEYLEKAQKIAKERVNNKYNVCIQSLLASNYSILGWHVKAIKLIESCISDEKEKVGAKESIGALYHLMCNVYQRKGDFDKAFECTEAALTYFNKNSDYYIYNIYLKASILLSHNKTNEGEKYLAKGLNISIKGSLLNTLIVALKSSATLNNLSSRRHLETISIPQLLNFGQVVVVLDCYIMLRQYYYNAEEYKNALKYSQMENEITKRFVERELLEQFLDTYK